eukprot:GHVU01003684.1.p1 GENE.GHVU01003684.1~~GHVU01003684.1.p1  ORF type:complete len:458 (+),score=21.12 GHVU01003684.1:1106-2479(+)
MTTSISYTYDVTYDELVSQVVNVTTYVPTNATTTTYNISFSNSSKSISCGSPLCNFFISPLQVCVAVVLGAFILAIIIGNIFVILSVLLFRDMRTLTNCLIVSLASADLLVAIVVLPISLHYEIVKIWTLGQVVCDIWITADVFCCTASILNIVVIAVDRYWLITKNVRYTHSRTFSRQRVCIVMVILAWGLSAGISSSPLMGWRRGDEKNDPNQCIISQDMGYTLFSTFGAFWFPLSVILMVYFRIFKIARRRARTRAKQRAVHPSVNSTVFSEVNGKAARYHRPSDSNSPQHVERNIDEDAEDVTDNQLQQQQPMQQQPDLQEQQHPSLQPQPSLQPERPGRHHHANNNIHSEQNHSRHRRRRTRSKLRNSARTLGLIIGGFVLCWLPFFILATVLPFCQSCSRDTPPLVMSTALWLGYSNSLLNPAIYAIWDKNFRRSFRKLSTCDVRWSNILM